ncbi:hypothetical protein ERX46_13375 [Brumimicrobium glaciale]|jgi:hypothetical protein|uniref:Uncharacterized protein n=1 Tax=Brumimicrobium glaciale TaxID=200475 RepID=A0A4V1WFF7_9FLAO|nr:hypothetical protein [Brumimicrobium glaciale]RYM33036.1 hypothetical protein ERX46_13375 [Brumimicrobium glaciale]
MLSTIFKKKVSDEQLANVFVNGVLDVIDKGFKEVRFIMEEDPAFLSRPQLGNSSDGHFAMIVIVGNINALNNSFSSKKLQTLEPLIFEKLADAFEMTKHELEEHHKDYTSFMNRVNHPSKVTLYSMSKAMFYKYKLNDFQDDYFKSMDSPNPLFLKRMDEIMKNFLWNWEAFFKRYKIHM